MPPPSPPPSSARPSLRLPVGGGLVLDAVEAGPADGPVVLLLHGFPQSSWCWRGVWPALAGAGLHVIAPDQRGYSPEARPARVQDYRMAALVADAVAVLDAVGADRAHVVGHDWGAAVAWQLAGRHPDRVRTLTAVSVPHPAAFVAGLRSDPDQRARSRYMKDWQDPSTEAALLGGGLAAVLGAAPGVDAEHCLRLLHEPGALTAALNWYRAQSAADLDGLGPITASTLHVWSDADPALGPAVTYGTAEHVAGPYRLEVLEGVGHWIPEAAAGRLSALLLEHLLEGGPAPTGSAATAPLASGRCAWQP
jgi:pimeloyl-ACP methyl ester carboxylesterase